MSETVKHERILRKRIEKRDRLRMAQIKSGCGTEMTITAFL